MMTTVIAEVALLYSGLSNLANLSQISRWGLHLWCPSNKPNLLMESNIRKKRNHRIHPHLSRWLLRRIYWKLMMKHSQLNSNTLPNHQLRQNNHQKQLKNLTLAQSYQRYFLRTWNWTKRSQLPSLNRRWKDCCSTLYHKWSNQMHQLQWSVQVFLRSERISRSLTNTQRRKRGSSRREESLSSRKWVRRQNCSNWLKVWRNRNQVGAVMEWCLQNTLNQRRHLSSVH